MDTLMPVPTGVILALIPGHETRERVTRALLGFAEVVFCARRAELLAALRRRPVSYILCEPWDADRLPVLPVVALLRSGFPSVPVVVYCRLAPADCREMAELARAGASEVIFRGLEDFGARARVLMRRADGTSVMGVALDRLDPWLTPGARAAFSYVVRHANRPVSVAEVAAALNVNRKTLRNRLTRAGFPAPSTVIAWCRLLRAAQALEDPRRTVCSVATALGFGSPAALRNLFRRHAGRRAAEVRASGGTAWLLDRFAARLIGSGRYDRTA